MSWFRRDSPFRSSLRGKLSSIMSQPPPVEHDAKACFESFKNHWQQAWETMCHSYNLPLGLPRSQLADQISGVLNHLDQMLMLLLNDLRRPEAIGPLLDLVLTEDILNKLLTWSLKTGEFVNTLKLEQLKLYEMLITQSQQEVLVHKPVLQPLLRLLSTCGECSPVEVEKRLVILLNQLCVSLTRNTTLLEFFFSANCNQGSANFLIFSLLIPFVHRDGGIGQQARDALLLCMSLSRKNESIGVYIAEHSSFCPVLATGLSGRYSALPRKLSPTPDDWHQFTTEDINEIEELTVFLNSLEFCNAVIQVSHPLVQEQLLEFLYQGFLMSVFVPALQPSSAQQACPQELATATAYLDLFLRTITEPSLIQVFLKMLFFESTEGRPVIETLILRIASQNPLCVTTLSLFHTLLDLNCEDVMLDLVFKYLIPCTHVMVSQRCRIRDIDMFGKSAEKFLSLMPVCCLPPPEDEQGSSGPPSFEGSADGAAASLPCPPPRRRRTPSTASLSPGDIFNSHRSLANVSAASLPPSSFLDYLLDVRKIVTSTFLACQCWAWPYDGERPEPEALFPLGLSLVNGVSADKRTYRASTGQADLNSSKQFLFSSNDNGVRKNSVSYDLVDVGTTPPLSSGQIGGSRNSSERELTPSNCDNESENRPTPRPRHLPQLNNELRKDGKNKLQQLPFVQNNVLSTQNSPSDGFGSPDLGPFLSILLTKLENMMNNSVYENLQLTGVIARLACYPQPLLRSFLLNHSLVFQPSVRSLLQVLGTLKQKLDSFFYTVDNIDDLMHRARRFLNIRDDRFLFDSKSNPNKSFGRTDRRNSTPEGLNKGENKRLSLTDRLFRRSPLSAGRSSRQDFLEGIPNDTGYRYVKLTSPGGPDGKLESLRTKNVVLCIVVLEEFLKELSAISMEHAIVWEDNANPDLTWQ